LRAITLFDIDGESRRSDLRVPELSDYISICKKYEKVAVLELKSTFTDDEIGKILAIIGGYDYLASVTFISFIPETFLLTRTVTVSEYYTKFNIARLYPYTVVFGIITVFWFWTSLVVIWIAVRAAAPTTSSRVTSTPLMRRTATRLSAIRRNWMRC
jgi:hypothetical protein